MLNLHNTYGGMYYESLFARVHYVSAHAFAITVVLLGFTGGVLALYCSEWILVALLLRAPFCPGGHQVIEMAESYLE